MSAKFTQGEWSVEYDGSIVMNGQIVSGAIGIDGSTQEEKKANSMLIAAAPELLEALIFCIEGLRTYAPEYMHGIPKNIYMSKASESIAKATGEAQ